MLVHVVECVFWVKGLRNDAASRINKSYRLQVRLLFSQNCLSLLRGLEQQSWNIKWGSQLGGHNLYPFNPSTSVFGPLENLQALAIAASGVCSKHVLPFKDEKLLQLYFKIQFVLRSKHNSPGPWKPPVNAV
jgi:hypothetical protein